MDNQPIGEQMVEESPVQETGQRQICTGTGDPREEENLLSAVSAEIKHLDAVLLGIDTDGIPRVAYLALTGAIILNILCLVSSTGIYMVLWILASLYFYLSYPLLPLILFLVPFLLQRQGIPVKQVNLNPLISWVKSLHLIRNHKIVLQLVIRFFLLSIMPMTSGMVLIYGLSLIFAVVLGVTGVIPDITSLLIVVQCLGILIFYLDLSFLKRQFTFFTQSLVVITHQNWMKYLLIGIIGILVVIIASCATVILLIAILLPGFTLGVYGDVTGFIQNRTNLWILLLLISQFIWMQYLQSIMSRRITRKFAADLSIRLKQGQALLTRERQLTTGDEDTGCPVRADNLQIVYKEVLSLLMESRIHTITRTHMAGLFPTYAIGVDVPEIFRIQTLEDLSGMFQRK